MGYHIAAPRRASIELGLEDSNKHTALILSTYQRGSGSVGWVEPPWAVPGSARIQCGRSTASKVKAMLQNICTTTRSPVFFQSGPHGSQEDLKSSSPLGSPSATSAKPLVSAGIVRPALVTGRGLILCMFRPEKVAICMAD